MSRPKTIEDDAVLEIARRVFQEKGHTATTRELAQAVGVSQGVLFQRFGTKDKLFFAAMLPPPPDFAALLGDENEAGDDTEEHFCRIAVRIYAYFESITPSILHLVTHPAFVPHAAAQVHDRLLASQLIEALAERIRVLQQNHRVALVEAHAAAQAFVAAIHSTAIFHVLSGGCITTEDRERTRSFISIFWNGLKPR